VSAGPAPAQTPAITVAEMNGRIEELQRQRDAALTRCATLAGSNALLRQTLTDAGTEIERLNGLVAASALPPADPAPAPTAH
jgi:hypothetical protein